MKEFTTAVEKAAEEDAPRKGIQFMVDGVEVTAHKPKDGQFAVLMASTGRHASENDQIAAVINFFASILDKSSYHYIEGKLLDYEDPFGMKQVQDILEWLVEEWSGRPTKSPSGSTQSPESTGLASTEPTPALI